tara:strand:+ start:208 stop:411 length:204 start_codon:yes stop_codon:yes gene_type:complete
MAPGWMQIAVIVIAALLLFGGRGKISSIMGDMAKGIKSFRTGLKDDDEDKKKKPEPIDVTPEKDKAS